MLKRSVAVCTAIAAVGMGLAASSQAVIDISWASSGGVYPMGTTAAQESTFDPLNGLLNNVVGNQVLLQLIDAGADGLANSNDVDFMGDSAGLTSGAATGDDVILQSFILGLPGDGTATLQANSGLTDFSAPNYSEPVFRSGTFYGRIFTSLTPTDGDFHFDGAVVAFADIPPLGTPQAYDLNAFPTSPLQFGVMPMIMVVPEPSTMALFGFGLLGLAARRSRNRNA